MASLALAGYDVDGPVGDLPGAWRARRRADGRTVLVRQVPPPDGPASLEELRRTLARVGALSADSLLPMHTVITTDQGLALVYDYPAGGPLSRILATRRQLTIGEVITLGTGLADALGQVHRAGLSHGHVRQTAVYVGLDGTPLLADVGLHAGTPEQDVLDLAGLCRGALGEGRRVGSGPAAAVLAVLAATEKHPPVSAADFGSSLRGAAPAVPIRLAGAVPAAQEWAAKESAEQERSMPQAAPGAENSADPIDPTVTAGRQSVTPARDGRNPDLGSGARPGLRDRVPASVSVGWRTRLRRDGKRFGGRAARRPKPAIFVTSIAVVLALLAAVALGVLWAKLSASHPAPGLPPRADAAAPTSPATADRSTAPPTAPTSRPPTATRSTPSPSPSTSPPAIAKGVSWLAVVRRLDLARAAAFAAADPTALAVVDAPSSQALRVDRQAATELRRRGAKARGLHWEVVRVAVESAGPPGVVLRVTDRMSAHDLISADGTVLATRPAREETDWRVTLLPGAEGWRFAQTVAA